MDNHIRLQFLGATGYVTGSRTLIESPQARIYIDTGLYQGPKYISDKNFVQPETEPEKIDAVFLTHGHIDHCGLLPLLYKKGFKGPVFCTVGTAELLKITLPDAGRIQEDDFKQFSEKKKQEYNLHEPLYTEKHAIETLELIHPVADSEELEFRDIKARWYWSGHIIGAGHLRFSIMDKSFLFSGDIGPDHNLFHKEKEKPLESDYVIMESTYGDRVKENQDYEKIIENCVTKVIKQRGMLILPCFAIGRAQLVLFELFRLQESGRIPHLPIYVDSPMVLKTIDLYLAFPEVMKKEVIDSGYLQFLKSERITRVKGSEDSKALNSVRGPGIIVTASGMCVGGRILHHLTTRIWDTRNIILFTGYQAEGSLGRLIQSGQSRVRIFKKEYPVRAQIESIKVFSAHADQTALVNWGQTVNHSKLKKLFLNHGQDESRQVLKEILSGFVKTEIELPKSESVFYINGEVSS